MAYNILGVVPGHNGSACVISDGELVYFLEEERLSRVKRDGNPFRVIHDIVNRYKIDEIVLAGVNDQSFYLPHTGEDLYQGMLRKYYPNTKFTWVGNKHHLTHSFCSFYNSGFTKSISIIVDGNGSKFNLKVNGKFIKSDEVETVYIHEYPYNYTLYNSTQLYHDLENNITNKIYNINNIGVAKTYEAISQYLGFGPFETGKTMGLSSYGKHNSNIPQLLKNKLIYNHYINGDTQMAYVKKHVLDKYLAEDIAWKIQNDSQQIIGNYIEKAINETKITQVCCSGGYFLNCVANYYLKKRFPNINFYFEPTSSDAGTAIGAAKGVWYQKTQNKTIKPQKTLYHGPKYSKKQLLKVIKKYTQ
tara:strand:- start:1028 stop:2107 length:1080 start_codon:yes stop_codon:yes gene_type:complete